MRRSVLLALCVAAAGAPAAAAAPSVQMMVVGRARTLLAPRSATLKSAKVTIGRRHCSVPAGTALAGLLATRLPVRVSDVAGCDPASMFVTRISTDRNHGLGGWEYKVGHSDPSTGAGDPAGRLSSGQRLLWYWCLRADACQRTLDLTVHSKSSTVQIQVRGYDDTGHGRTVAGATVHVGTSMLTTNAEGWIELPAANSPSLVYATKPGMVRSFPTVVGVTP